MLKWLTDFDRGRATWPTNEATGTRNGEWEEKAKQRSVCMCCMCVLTAHMHTWAHSNAQHVHIHYVGAAFLLCSEAECDQVSNDDILIY